MLTKVLRIQIMASMSHSSVILSAQVLLDPPPHIDWPHVTTFSLGELAGKDRSQGLPQYTSESAPLFGKLTTSLQFKGADEGLDRPGGRGTATIVNGVVIFLKQMADLGVCEIPV